MLIKKFLIFSLAILLAETVHGQLSAQFSADPLSGCAPIRIQFTDLSTGGATGWKWDLGNGTISAFKDPSTVYFNPGVYTVKLTVYNGPTDSATIIKTNYILVNPIPIINFGASPLQGCTPVSVKFTDSSTTASGNFVDWQWDFGDGFLGSGKNPVHLYNSAGIFKVTLTATNNFGCKNSFSRTNYITVFDSLRANFGIKNVSGCAAPVSVQFGDSSVGKGITKWTWDFGDGTILSGTNKNPTHSFSIPGTYSVKLVIENANGCKDSILRKNIVNVGNFTANFSMQVSTCASQTVNMTNTSTPLNLLSDAAWDFGDGTFGSGINTSHAFNATGTYKVKMVAFFGACKDSFQRFITVVPQPTAAFEAVPTGACKPPLKVQFANSTIGGTVVAWYFGNGETSTLNNPVTTYTNYGSYNVRLIVKNSNGCFDTLDKRGLVVIKPPVIAEITGPLEGCLQTPGTFDVKVDAADAVVKWEWDFGDGQTSTLKSPEHSFADTGTYNVSVVITTRYGCTDTFSTVVRRGRKPTPKFGGGPRLVCPLDEVHFFDSSTGFINKWVWVFGDGGQSFEQNPEHKYNDTGWMRVSLTVYGNGCADSTLIDSFLYVKPPIASFRDSGVCGDQSRRFFIDGSKFGPVTDTTYRKWLWYIDDPGETHPVIFMDRMDSVFYFGPSDSAFYYGPVVLNTGVHHISLKVQDGICEHQASQDVFILNEKPDFTWDPVGHCNFTNVSFTASGPSLHPAYIKDYKWKFGDGSSLITDTPYVMHTYYQAGIANVELTVTDLNGCKSFISKSIDVPFQPAPKFGPSSPAVCLQSAFTFIDSTFSGPTNPVKEWRWNFGDGTDTVFTAPPFTHQYKDTGAYVVKLTIIDTAGCSGTSKPDTVLVYKPSVDFMSPDTLVCVGAPVDFTSLYSGHFQNVTYRWDFDSAHPNLKTSSDPNPQNIKYFAAGKYTVTLTVTDANCSVTETKHEYITVGNAKAFFDIDTAFTSCPPLVVGFTNNSLYNTLNNWDFGDGNTSTIDDPSHTYTQPGTFWAKLVVAGNGGCSDSIFKKIQINGPQGKLIYTARSACPPLRINFSTDSVKNTALYTWDFGDGKSIVTVTPNTRHVYEIPGAYVPKLVLSDTAGCNVPRIGPDTIKVVGAKAFIKSLPKYEYCDSTTVSFFDSTITTDVVTSYKWDLGDGTQTSDKDPIHSYNKTGIYNVTFEVRTLGGCVTIDTIPTPVIVAPTPQIEAGKDTGVCVPSTVQFQGSWINQDTSAMQWKWIFGNGKSSTDFIPSPVSYTLPGKYPVTFLGMSNYGCGDTTSLILTVNDTPRIVAGPSSYICLGTPVTLGATGAKDYSWDNTTSLSCLNCQNPRANPPAQEIFRVVGTDINGCKSSDTLLIKVKQPGHIIVGPGDTLCIGESFLLQASGTEKYKWQPPTGLSSTTISNPLATPSATTKYKVVGYDTLGCFYDSGFITVAVYPIPKFNIVEDRIVAATGTIVTIKTTSSPDINRWRWAPPIGLNCIDCPEPQLTVTKPVTLTARVANLGNCRAQDKVTIVPICNNENVFIPNTFSPNGDGHNDMFYPRGRGLAAIKSMRIFNRWGELLFEQKNFAVNDPNAGWDGSYKGQKLTPDVYVYMIDVLCENTEVISVKGNITLLK